MNDSNRGTDSGRWQLDRAAFEALLSALHADPGVAAREYERLRRRLMRYFVLNGIARAAESTDEAFNRLAMRLSQGTHILKVEAFLAGVARLLVLEERQRLERERRMLGRWVAEVDEPVQESERFLQALEDCLGELPPQARDLLCRYYSEDGATRIRTRAALARELELSPNSLRNRVLRLRHKLERTVRERLGEGPGEADSQGGLLWEED